MLRRSCNNVEVKVDGGGEEGIRQQLLCPNSNHPGLQYILFTCCIFLKSVYIIYSIQLLIISQSATRPGVSFHPAIKKEFGGKRPRVEEGLDGKRPRVEEGLDGKRPKMEEGLETGTGMDLVEVKKEEEEEKDSKEFVIMDQEKLQGTKMEFEENLEQKKPRYA